MNMFKKNGGFTLVELIVVIAILAILAGVAVPVYSGYISKANEAADYTMLDSVKTAAVFAAMEQIDAGVVVEKITVAPTAEDAEDVTVTVKYSNGPAVADTSEGAAEGATTTSGETPVKITQYVDAISFKSGAAQAIFSNQAVEASEGVSALKAGWNLVYPEKGE